MKKKFKKVFYRMYNDYLMKNRYSEYENLILDFKNNGYEFIKISEYNKLKEKGKHIIIRHDIDSDVKIARKMFEIEKKNGVKTTFFFRKRTLNDKLIKEIIDYGSEFGYHYEEIATYIKDNKLKSKEEIIDSIKNIQKLFEKNLRQLEEKYNVKICSIAAHGDFINRKYKITNDELFNLDLRKKYPSIIEAYDKKIEGNLNRRTSDDFGPNYWKPIIPKPTLEEKDDNILILVHTRYWNKAPIERFKEDFLRIIEGIENK